ncbi:hypothetical protein CCP3SC1AL1_2210004 [Gammaproteobacteria bacterium]
MAYKIKKAKGKWKMGIYEDGVLVDYGIYDSEEDAEEDFKSYDEPKGRTHIIEQE